MSEQPTSAQGDSAVPRRSWYLLGVLTMSYVMALVDRKLPFILVEPIKHDLGLSDTQIGLLTGAMFTVVYTTCSIPVAKLADRYSRKWVMVASLTVWSALTSAGGLATNVWQLGIARAGVALGESGSMPASHSMISASFPESRRALAAGIFSAGAPIGMLLGLAGGGILVDLWDWRTAMIVVGAPGLVIALLMAFTVREPIRPAVSVTEPKIGVWPAVKTLLARPSFRHLALAGMVSSCAGAASQTFGPAFIMRTHGLSAGETGVSYGLLVGVGGLVGALLGGYVSDRTRSRDERIGLWFVAAVIALGGVLQIAAWAAPNYGLFLLFMALPQLALMVNVGTVYPAVQALAGVRMRAMSIAIYLFLVVGFGHALGPVLAGLLSDMLAPTYGVRSLEIGLIILSALKLWAAAHYFIAAFKLPGDLVLTKRHQSEQLLATA